MHTVDGQDVRQYGGKGGKGRAAIIGIIVLVMVAVLAVIIIYLLWPQDEPTPNRVVTPENVDEVVEQMKDDGKAQAGTYDVTMSTEWTFPDGKSPASDAFVENCTDNTNTVYFTIALDDGGQELYRSPYLEVGSQLADIKLDEELEKGTYKSIITYHLVDDGYNEVGRVSMYMTINIEN